MAKDPEQLAHLEWLGYVQPVGLVVSVPALLAAQAHVNRNIAPEHARFLTCLPRDKNDDVVAEIRDFAEFTQTVLGWEAADLTPVPDADTLPDEFASLEVILPEYHETLRPTHVVKEFEPVDSRPPWLMLIRQLPADVELDEPHAASNRNWQASPHAKFERLLRETSVPIGLLVNGTQLRLVYAPRGETSGYMTFSVPEMAQVAGRPIFAALHTLLSAERLFTLPEKQRLPAILEESRRYQNVVSTKLAEQVLAALYELLRGFQSANDQLYGQLLKEVLDDEPNHVYAGLLNVLMRLVFVLYAEDRSLMPADPLYGNHYSVTGLFERLRADAGRHPDTMDHRYGAWAQLLALFRLIYQGGSHGDMRLPGRKGYLFDPQRYPFLEGQIKARSASEGSVDDGEDPSLARRASILPRVSDGVVFRVLRNLLILDGERLSYRTLDVEQIGSVYETIMGFYLEVAKGRSIAIKPVKSHGAPATINLEALLACKPKDRVKWLKDQTDQKLTGAAATALKDADSIDALLAALDRKIAKKVTPNVVPKGAMVFQPSDERRRSGSHYTPRSLTEPIVRTTLKPILERLATHTADDPEASPPHPLTPSPPHAPTPQQILNLKICDPAMGSGAFLVEACRQLGDELVRAWHVHDCVPGIPPDEDELLHARRLVAQRCLYGVDKNPMAVDLARLSLWLATLAKDHPFTFLDHALRCGDSLVGLGNSQLAAFHWDTGTRDRLRASNFEDLEGKVIETRIQRASEYRRQILDAREDVAYLDQESRLALADESLQLVRFLGDLVVSAFFAGQKKKQRLDRCDELFVAVSQWFASNLNPALRPPLAAAVHALHTGPFPVQPFHWEIEFPEVFDRENGGFVAFVGNPPFLGGRRTSYTLGSQYSEWLAESFPDSSNNADIVAFFFRRSFQLLRHNGVFGLLATNTISQGDTRSTGLRWICKNKGCIYSARKRLKWPGLAAVTVSVIHIAKGVRSSTPVLDGRDVSSISAYLFQGAMHESPARLLGNANKSFQGMIVLGMGFTFDDSDNSGSASSIADMRRLLDANARNKERISPYIGGEEILESPTHAFRRYVIDFNDMDFAAASAWPDLLDILRERVKPDRDKQKRKPLRERWWQFADKRPALRSLMLGRERILVHPFTSTYLAFAFLPTNVIVAGPHQVFVLSEFAHFCLLQSQIHETWARFFASSMEDRLRYASTDCFETFPFPEDFETNESLEAAGRGYYEFRADLMVKNDEGLTKTYNRFHDPDERRSDILKLRELHAAMDRAVLEAYGWHDLAETATCEFLLDYEEDEESEVGGQRSEVGKKRKKKKPWRYRWPDDFRDEVLARLLELNKLRAEEERITGLAAKGGKGSRKAAGSQSRAKKSKGKAGGTGQREIFGDDSKSP